MSKIISVVLSGGVGERLWPDSREGQSKPFIKLFDGETLIHKTYARVKALDAELITITNRDYYFMSKDQQDLANVFGTFLLEPFAKDTAAAVALAAKYISEIKSPEAIILVMAADHLIDDQKKFNSAVKKAIQLAENDYLVTFGVAPTSPQTGFGYIESGEVCGCGNKVTRFIEKPDFATAQKYLDSGRFLWNSGIFCFKAGVILDELKKYSPEILDPINICWAAMQPLSNPLLVDIPKDFFGNVPSISIDLAVMEKSDRVAVVSGDFGWSDVGSWAAISSLVEPDLHKNRLIGDAIFVDSTDTFIKSGGRLVAALGVKNLMIIETQDAVLVANKNNLQDVKKVVTRLKALGHQATKTHRTVLRPWGSYTILGEGAGFKIKKIEVKPMSSLSLQMHHHRSEHWVVVSGIAKITNGNQEIFVYPNQSAYIPAGQMHRLENPGDTPCIMIEVQCGDYLGEDDIQRFDDKYGR